MTRLFVLTARREAAKKRSPVSQMLGGEQRFSVIVGAFTEEVEPVVGIGL